MFVGVYCDFLNYYNKTYCNKYIIIILHHKSNKRPQPWIRIIHANVIIDKTQNHNAMSYHHKLPLTPRTQRNLYTIHRKCKVISGKMMVMPRQLLSNTESSDKLLCARLCDPATVCNGKPSHRMRMSCRLYTYRYNIAAIPFFHIANSIVPPGKCICVLKGKHGWI